MDDFAMDNFAMDDSAMGDFAAGEFAAGDSTKKRALRILGKRSFSEREMAKRLISKGEDAEDAENAVKWLVELGYINDQNFAGQIVNHYAAKGYGQARIKDELSRRGIPREMWDEHLSALDDEAGADAAVEYLRKKCPSGGSSDNDSIRRTVQGLVRRGFSFDEAHSAVKRYLDICQEELE